MWHEPRKKVPKLRIKDDMVIEHCGDVFDNASHLKFTVWIEKSCHTSIALVALMLDFER